MRTGQSLSRGWFVEDPHSILQHQSILDNNSANLVILFDLSFGEDLRHLCFHSGSFAALDAKYKGPTLQ